MRFAHVTIENYKGLRSVSIPFSQFVCLIGQNNAGKSSLLQAVLLLIEGKKIPLASFYDQNCDVVIRADLEGISEDDLSLVVNFEHRARVRDVVVDGRLSLVRRYSSDGTVRLRWITHEPNEPRFAAAAREELTKSQRPGNAFVARVITAFPELAEKLSATTTVAGARKLIDELAKSLPADQKKEVESDVGTGIDGSVRSILPEPIYIPAVKDFLDDIKTREGTSFGKLLGMLLGAIGPELSETEQTFQTLNERLNITFDASGSPVDNRLDPVRRVEMSIHAYVQEQFPLVDIKLKIPPPELKTILSSAKIVVDDGVAGDLETKGDGLKRSVTFAILRAYASLKRDPGIAQGKRSSGYILIFEEPELYLHPTAQQILFDALYTISRTDQVVISTHSPLFFSPDATGTFVKIVKQPGETATSRPFSTAFPIDLTEVDQRSRFHIISYDTSNQAFFFSTVLLVEGMSDHLLFPHLARSMNPDWCVNKHGVALCRVNGKGSIRRYRSFFSKFDVRIVVLADLDCLIDGFDHLGANVSCVEKRARLLEAIDSVLKPEWARARGSARESAGLPPFTEGYREMIRSGVLKPISNDTIREIYDSAHKRESWIELVALYDQCLAGGCTLADFKQAGDAFFSRQVSKDRRTVLEGHATPEIDRLKHELLIMLRQSDILLLSRGPIEAYLPEDCKSADKPTQALRVREVLRDAQSIRALWGEVPIAGDGARQNELEHICELVFEAEGRRNTPSC